MTAITAHELDSLIRDELPSLIELRHDLHAHPQLAYEETHASGAVQDELKKAGVDFEAGLAVTGVVGWIVPDDTDRAAAEAVGLRADMDALPIFEETGLQYASQNEGKMHACGHDGHTTVLVGAARVLARLRDRLPRPVKLLFQPAEEGKAGAAKMIEDGVLEETTGGTRIGMMFGLHGDPRSSVGRFATCAGAFMAATDEIRITVTGRGGHAALPQFTADPIVASGQIVSALQSVVARNVNPIDSAVITVGAIHGGDAFNVIPETVEMAGTVRTFKPEIRDVIVSRITEVVERTAEGMGCTGEVKFLPPHYPALYNHEDAVRYAANVAREALGEANVDDQAEAIMGGEDFAFYGSHVPICFAFIGVRPPERDEYPGLHTSRYDFTDDAIEVGVKLMCQWALNSERMGK